MDRTSFETLFPAHTERNAVSVEAYVDQILTQHVGTKSERRMSATCTESYIDQVMERFVYSSNKYADQLEKTDFKTQRCFSAPAPGSPTPTQMSDTSTECDFSSMECLRTSSAPDSVEQPPKVSILKKGLDFLRKAKSFNSISWKNDEVREFDKEEADEDYKTFKPRFAIINGQRILLQEDQKVVMNQFGQQFVITVQKTQPKKEVNSCTPQRQQQSQQYLKQFTQQQISIQQHYTMPFNGSSYSLSPYVRSSTMIYS